jgi:hypothetical protein
MRARARRPRAHTTAGKTESEQPGPEPWPVLAEEARYGLPGEIVRAIDPFTEADPVAVLITLLAMFGNCISASAYFRVEHTKHFVRLFVALVGKTSKSRKGQSLSTLRYMFETIDSDWSKDLVVFGGLSSGEGLIYHTRDARYSEKDGEKIDAGVSDKRLLLIEEELVSALKVASREGNTLSAILRQAWDRGDLRPLTKNSPIRATGAHISIVSHITRDELLRHLTETDQTNGFADRFLWLLVQRSKFISRPCPVPEEILTSLIDRLRKAVDFARKTTEIDRNAEAEELWGQMYPELSGGKPGLFGAIIARAEAQTMRLACLYALLDCSSEVRIEHLRAALSLWDYAEESARLIFGDSLGDPVADAILDALKRNTEGLTRTDISYHFDRHRKAGEIDRALGVLLAAGKARREEEQTKGRPVERWYEAKKAKEANKG